MPVKLKHHAFSIKSPADGPALKEGEFTGYAAVFNNVDSYGDTVHPGAFTKSLETYGPDGAGIPCYWGHRMDDPNLNIGVTVSAVEDDKGLKVHVALDLDNPQAAYVHKLIKQGRVKQMSFAYAVTDGKYNDDDVYVIKECEIFEVSVVPVGANPQAWLTAVKAAELASGEDTTGPDEDKDLPEVDIPATLELLKQTSGALSALVDYLEDTAADPASPDEDEDETAPREDTSPDAAEDPDGKAAALTRAKALARATLALAHD